MTSINIRFIAASLLAAACIASAHGQVPPINAAASVNGLIITNDMVEQGIKTALAQGQKDSPDLRNAVLSRLIEVSLLAQQADKDGLANSDKANSQLTLPSTLLPMRMLRLSTTARLHRSAHVVRLFSTKYRISQLLLRLKPRQL